MYADSNQLFVVSMLNSGLFLVKDDQEEIDVFDVLRRPPALDFQDIDRHSATVSRDLEARRREQEIEDEGNKEEEEVRNVRDSKEIRRKPSLGELKATDDDGEDDGFRTPTSSDHKIPKTKQCPPAPRKPKALPSRKRKASPIASSCSWSTALQVDLSREVESLFPKNVLADFHRKIRKARREEETQ